MTTKMRLKVGEVEIEYEGDPDFITNGLTSLLAKIVQTLDQHPDLTGEGVGTKAAHAGGGKPKPSLHQSTSTIAAKFKAKTGPDLVMAAATHLAVVKGMAKFTRKEIAEEMQSATSFYKSGFMGNLTKYLAGLVKAERLNLIVKDTYSLSDQESKSVEAQLAK